MDLSTIESRLGQIPATFLREGSVFAAWQLSQALQLYQYSLSSDSAIPQTNFSTADWGWLDVWGSLFGIPRNPNEANSAYQTRITSTLESPVGTLYAITAFSSAYFFTPITVTENLPELGYTITIPASIPLSSIPQYLINLQKIRPAGVPFTVIQLLESTFLNTFQYLRGAGTAGAYLGGGSNNLNIVIPEPINNSQVILPGLLITDPLLSSQISP